MTREAAAELLEVSVSSIRRREDGLAALKISDLTAMMDLYGIQDRIVRAEMTTLAREGRLRGWWQPFNTSLRPTFSTFLGLESDARQVDIFSAILIPGLLQTEPYTRAVMAGAVPTLPDELVTDRVAVRRQRQERLSQRDPLRLHAVLDEACLRRVVGGAEVLREQLKHLLDMIQSRNVTVQILPFAVGAHAATLGAFSLLSYADAPRIAYVELAAGDLYAESVDADIYAQTFDALREAALPPAMTAGFIEEIAGKV